MREFFKSWRRKAGLVTLALALVVAIAFVRSLVGYDGVVRQRVQLLSLDGVVALRIGNGPASDASWWDTTFFYHISKLWLKQADWQLRLLGFRFGVAMLEDGWMFVVPHWAIILVLTLYSAFLLLGKPRPANQPDSCQPPETDHA